MATDEGKPGAEAPEEDDIGKNLFKQLAVVGGIVFLIMLAAVFGAF